MSVNRGSDSGKIKDIDLGGVLELCQKRMQGEKGEVFIKQYGDVNKIKDELFDFV